MKATAKVVSLLRALQAGWTTFQWDQATAVLWSETLERYTDGQLMQAVRVLARTCPFAPNVANVVEAIEGRIVRVPEHAIDVWGRKILGRDGAPVVCGWRYERLPLEIAERPKEIGA